MPTATDFLKIPHSAASGSHATSAGACWERSILSSINGANQLGNTYLAQKFSISFTSAGMVANVLGLSPVLGGLTYSRITGRTGQKKK